VFKLFFMGHNLSRTKGRDGISHVDPDSYRGILLCDDFGMLDFIIKTIWNFSF